MDIAELQKRLAEFAKERDWDQFHSPKNLSMALAGEVGEFIELFQWMTDEESRTAMSNPKTKAKVDEEIADVFLYLIRVADKLGVDLCEVAAAKIKVNAEKYPVHLAKGSAEKYNRR
jgi:NTP pyrophosphatase (non-canonical NTP hydrolase)